MTTKTSKKTTLRASDLNCPSCVSKIETALKAVDGVVDAEVKFATGKILVEHDPSTAKVDDLIGAVRSAGYTAKPSAF
jgi:copper chaperone CopZ